MRASTYPLRMALAVAAFLVLAVSPVLATGEETDEATEAPAVTTDVEPAVQVTTPAPSEATPDWTYRYMVPTGLLLAVVIIVITSIQYFTRVVRGRYRIIEE